MVPGRHWPDEALDPGKDMTPPREKLGPGEAMVPGKIDPRKDMARCNLNHREIPIPREDLTLGETCPLWKLGSVGRLHPGKDFYPRERLETAGKG